MPAQKGMCRHPRGRSRGSEGRGILPKNGEDPDDCVNGRQANQGQMKRGIKDGYGRRQMSWFWWRTWSKIKWPFIFLAKKDNADSHFPFQSIYFTISGLYTNCGS